jgi:hypothetical protein
MFESGFYTYTTIPQWGIFIGILLVVIGAVDKKDILTQIGWLSLVLVGAFTAYINLSGVLDTQPISEGVISPEITLNAIGWQTTIGSILTAFTIMLKRIKSRRYTTMAILTIAFFVIVFFQYHHFTKSITPII